MKRSIQLCLVAAALISAGSLVSAQLNIAEIPYDSVANFLKIPQRWRSYRGSAATPQGR